ncbi:outer membrane porin [Burkholderia lata]|uniref:Outer membrane porin n=1 Tax=Burkholderia lata (strain ATCC 17760 / DSM 23089 / LMG 22485 / NCIMB 9086 / R18194 / 383) TaxID=482957 RepID=A0A6P2HF73_BURL3|nr:porin [Burkholderia lata]VWB15400.1 outer membrane porin [Burkholderia lata]
MPTHSNRRKNGRHHRLTPAVNRRLLSAVGASLIACTIADDATAQSSVSLYGLADVYVGTQKSLGKPRAYAMNSGGFTTSFWGIGGREDLGGGYALQFALEAFMRPSNGGAGRFSGDTFFGRNAYVGVATPYGVLRAGRNTTPYYISVVRFNPFSTSFGFSPALNQMYKGVAGQGLVGDNGWSNSVLVSTPGEHALQASLIYATGNEPGHAGANQWGGSVTYDGHRAFSATLAFQQAKFDRMPGDLNASIAGFTQQDAVLAGVGYDLTFVKFTAFYQYVHDAIDGGGLGTHSGQVGAAVPLGFGTVLASVMAAKSHGRDRPSRTTWALGYDYRLSKRTDVYVAYMRDRASGYGNGDSTGLGLRTAF